MSAPVIWRLGPHLSLRLPRRAMAGVVLLAAGAAVGAVLALAQGSEPVPLSRLLGWMGIGEARPDRTQALVLEVLRAPRICLALCAGALLALAGAVTQDLTRNGLADPALMGVREGASLAIIATMLLWPALPMTLRPLPGLAGGGIAGLVVITLARRTTPMRFILTGLALSWALSSVQVILLSFATTPQLEAALFWLSGQLQAADWASVRLAAGTVALGLALLLWVAPRQDLEALGPELATSLGAASPALRRMQMVLAAGFVAVAVSIGGGLGFVGLIAPHLARAGFGRHPRCRLLATALIGAALVLAADTLGRRLFAPVELPAGLVLAVLGAPALLWLMRRRKSGGTP